METLDLDRIRFVTRRFNDLQGFRRLVPAGLLLLGGAALTSLAGWPRVVLPLALLAGACLLLAGARRYYAGRFGETEEGEAQPVAELSSLLLAAEGARSRPVIPLVPRFLILGGLVCAVFILFQFLLWPPWITIDSEVVSWTGDPEMTRVMLIRMIYGLCALFFLGTWWLREHRPSQGHLIGFWLLLSALCVLAPWYLPAAVGFGAALLVCGSSLVLAGVVDHWQLVRVLGPREEE